MGNIFNQKGESERRSEELYVLRKERSDLTHRLDAITNFLAGQGFKEDVSLVDPVAPRKQDLIEEQEVQTAALRLRSKMIGGNPRKSRSGRTDRARKHTFA